MGRRANLALKSTALIFWWENEDRELVSRFFRTEKEALEWLKVLDTYSDCEYNNHILEIRRKYGR